MTCQLVCLKRGPRLFSVLIFFLFCGSCSYDVIRNEYLLNEHKRNRDQEMNIEETWLVLRNEDVTAEMSVKMSGNYIINLHDIVKF